MAPLKKINLFIPTGAMRKKIEILTHKAGLFFTCANERDIDADVVESKIFERVSFLSSNSIPNIVSSGNGENNIGFVGFSRLVEWLIENMHSRDTLKILAVLNFSRNTSQAADVVICCKKGSEFDPKVIKRELKKSPKISGLTGDQLLDGKNVKVHAEYPAIARQYFKRAEIIDSAGGTEGDVAQGLADYAVLIRDSGKSIEQSGLVVVKEFFSAPIVLIGRKEVLEIAPGIKDFADGLIGALAAEKYVYLKMNAPDKGIGKILEILPSMHEPTVSELGFRTKERNGKSDQEEKWHAIETMVLKTRSLELRAKLRELGATDFVEQEVNLVITPGVRSEVTFPKWVKK